MVTLSAMSGFQPAITVQQAMSMIHNRELLIPAFQREFVWDAVRVENLFDSIMKGYPISSMLFWNVTADNFSSFDFYDFLPSCIYGVANRNQKVVSFTKPFCAVLDGQQRLTSLYLGLYGTYAYHMRYHSWTVDEKNYPSRKLYLNLTKKLNEEEGQKTYNFAFLSEEDTQKRDVYRANGELWMRVGVVMQITRVNAFCREHELSDEESDVLEQLCDALCKKPIINYYLETSVEPKQAVNIFVRINSGGKALSISDILQSITINGWTVKNAREQFQNLIDKVQSLGFNISHDYILKSFLCLFHSSVKFQINSFDTEFLRKTEAKWDEVKEATLSLFTLLRNYGFTNGTLKSYNATLPILCYLYWNGKYSNFATLKMYEADRLLIKKWLMKNLILRSFGSSADSTLQAAIKCLRSQGTFPSDEVQEHIGMRFTIDDSFVEELLKVQKDDPYAFSILSLLYPDANYALTKFDKDHLHPGSRFNEYKKLGGTHDWPEYNSIVNLQLLEESRNQSKNDAYLKDWVDSEVKLRSNLYVETYIPVDCSLKLADFDTFYDKRKVLLAKKLKEVMG